MIYRIGVFVPKSHLEAVKEAMFLNGAGRYNNYERCSWETEGTGQFRPIGEADPYTGTKGKLERLTEYRVEMICDGGVIKEVLAGMIDAHPYEEPAYDVVEIKTIGDF